MSPHRQGARPALTAALQAVNADAARLRALVLDIVTAAYHAPAPDWLTDDLWARLTAETPRATDYTRPTPTTDIGLFELEDAP